jgi:predicted lipoprotein with Yx(FWY)xxD motif
MKNSVIIGAVIVIAIIVAVGVVLLNTNRSSSAYTVSTVGTSAYTTVGASSATSSQLSTASTSIGANTTSYTVVLESSSTYGSYLANASGYTLYTYTGDTQNSGTSNCNSSCASDWPPFYTASVAVQPGLSASSFGTITRSDGTKQTTYNGYPLYFFAGDGKPNVVNGNNVGGFKVAVT